MKTAVDAMLAEKDAQLKRRPLPHRCASLNKQRDNWLIAPSKTQIAPLIHVGYYAKVQLVTADVMSYVRPSL